MNKKIVVEGMVEGMGREEAYADRSFSDTSSRGGLSERFRICCEDFLFSFPFGFSLMLVVSRSLEDDGKQGIVQHCSGFGLFVLYGARLGQLL